MHSRDERVFTWCPAVESRLDSVRTVAGELDMGAAGKGALGLMSRMMLPEGTQLKDLYRKKDWPKVEASMNEQFGTMSSMFQRMKPFFILAMMAESAMAKDRPRVLDDHLMVEARSRDKHVLGLETLDEQLGVMSALPLKEQAAMLLDHVEQGGYKDELDQLMDAYAAQDLAALMRLTERSNALSTGFERTLITDRNIRMAHRMDSLLRADTSALFLVGAAHLPGQSGVVQLLRLKGYTVEPILLSKGPALAKPDTLPAGHVRFRNDTLGFEAVYPAAPMKVASTVSVEGTPLVNWFAEEVDGSAYMIFTCQLDDDVSNTPNDSLLVTLAAGGGRNKGRLVSIYEVNTAYGSASEAVTHFTREDRYLRMRLIRPEAKLAYLLIVSPPKGVEPKGQQRFFEGFRLLDR